MKRYYMPIGAWEPIESPHGPFVKYEGAQVLLDAKDKELAALKRQVLALQQLILDDITDW